MNFDVWSYFMFTIQLFFFNGHLLVFLGKVGGVVPGAFTLPPSNSESSCKTLFRVGSWL